MRPMRARASPTSSLLVISRRSATQSAVDSIKDVTYVPPGNRHSPGLRSRRSDDLPRSVRHGIVFPTSPFSLGCDARPVYERSKANCAISRSARLERAEMPIGISRAYRHHYQVANRRYRRQGFYGGGAQFSRLSSRGSRKIATIVLRYVR